jgi:poly-gamma-glutamate synthesis protein (capsule biosynthesis protein)
MYRHHSGRRAVLSAIVVLLGSAARIATATGAQAPGAEAPADRARVLFVGDMFFDRFIRQKSERLGPDFPFLCIDPLLHSADMVVGNLEGPITDHGSVSVGTIPGSPNNYRFTFPIQTAAALLRHNIKAVSLGNNHILNFGRDGLEQTRRFLDAAGVGHFGGVAGSEPVYRIDLNGVKLSFVAYNQFGGSAPQDVADVVAHETAAQRVVVVFPHWGIEYSTDTSGIGATAALFARNGAAAVIGAHPHVVGDRAKIGDTVVFYSLGNFIFDQYSSAPVMHGLAVMLTFSGNEVADVQEYPTRLALNGQTCPAK